MLVAGIDESGKGSSLSSMFFACVVMESYILEQLKSFGLQDSKKLSEKKREELFKLIRDSAIQIIVVSKSSEDITKLQDSGTNLNRIGVESFAECITRIKDFEFVERVYVDAADVNAARFGENIFNILFRKHKTRYSNLKIVSEHKADDKFPVVSAASVVAKHCREKNVRKMHKIWGNFGSGYPNKDSDTFIENYYRKHGKLPEIARANWANVKKIVEKIEGEKKIEKLN